MRKVFSLSIMALLMLSALAIGLSSARPAAAASVSPIYYEGNPTCGSLGYGDFEFKIDPPNSGVYTIPGTSLTIEITNKGDGTLDWDANFGIDAVFMKGGPGGNLYVYNPEVKSDTGLSTPINSNNGKPYGLSHVSFCYDLELMVSKTAETTYTRTYTWTIDKEKDGTHVGFIGDPAFWHDYKVTVDQTITDSDFAVHGQITIVNPAPQAALITSVVDKIDGTISATVDCKVSFPYSLAAGQTLICDYWASLPDKALRENVATVTTSGKVGGGTGKAPVSFGDPTKVVGYPKVNVTDDIYGAIGEFDKDGYKEYKGSFQCPTDLALYTDGVWKTTVVNTAQIVETGQKDSATVKLTCYAPLVSKTVYTAYTRTWTWTLDKTANKTSLMLSPGQYFTANYEVLVNAAYQDSAFKVFGEILIKNPGTKDMLLEKVTDLLPGDLEAEVTCPAMMVKAGETLTCAYKAYPLGKITGDNTAMVKFNGIDFTAKKEIVWGGPTTKIDECLDLSDSLYGDLGTVCWNETPKTIKYSYMVGPYLECGKYQVINTATGITKDTKTKIEDTWTIDIDVPCLGCTLTPGYWKTHSKYGPAPADEDWYKLGDVDGDGKSEGPDETFFLSGKTYYQVLWTPPQGGNAYYILAHAYIAAKLNIANGAWAPDNVKAAIVSAETFFATKKPTDTLSKAERAKVIGYAELLDKYNNGAIGPGHCSE